jgi:hypothetical protein
VQEPNGEAITRVTWTVARLGDDLEKASYEMATRGERMEEEFGIVLMNAVNAVDVLKSQVETEQKKRTSMIEFPTDLLNIELLRVRRTLWRGADLA